MEAVEAVVVGDGVVGLALDEELDNVVSLLGDGVVKGRVSLGILNGRGSAVMHVMPCHASNLHPH